MPAKRDAAYWAHRNALVDAVHAAGRSAPSDWSKLSAWYKTVAGIKYTTALEVLRAFDRKHGGAPIL